MMLICYWKSGADDDLLLRLRHRRILQPPCSNQGQGKRAVNRRMAGGQRHRRLRGADGNTTTKPTRNDSALIPAFDLMVTPPTASWDPIPGRLFQPPARRPVRRCVGCTSKHHRISGWASKRRVGQSKKKTRGQPPQRPKTNCPTLQRAALPRPAPQRAPAGASRRRRETKARARGSQSNCRHNRPWGSVANWVALHSRRKPPQARASNTA